MPMRDLLTRTPGRYRLATLLVCVVAAAVCFSEWIGRFPGTDARVIDGRRAFCQSLAISGDALVGTGNTRAFEAVIGDLVHRVDSVRSVRLIDANGRTRVQTEGHRDHWSADAADRHSNIAVPIHRFGKRWGTVQVAFADIARQPGRTRDGAAGRLLLTLPICFLLFSVILSRAADSGEPTDSASQPIECEPSPDAGSSPESFTPSDPSTVDETAPIRCRLPLDDEEYLEIVLDFIERMDARLMGMLSMIERRGFEDLESEAHWLKGAGGTVGFPDLTEPSRDLMNAARHGDVHRCQETMQAILQIRQRIVVPEHRPQAAADS